MSNTTQDLSLDPHGAHGHGAHDNPHLGEQFEDIAQQYDTYTVGMWAFIVQEVMFFGGVFAAYAIYRYKYLEAFSYAHLELDVFWGTVNTFVLLFSSFTMALGVRAAMLQARKAQIGFFLATILFACVFMGVKYVEYSAKFDHGLIPGHNFTLYTEHLNEVREHHPHVAEAVEKNPALVPQMELFFGFYFAMTGLHGLHVLIGIIVIGALVIRAWINKNKPLDYMPVEMVGLYWHLVDIVWIFLFPLLYLVGGH